MLSLANVGVSRSFLHVFIWFISALFSSDHITINILPILLFNVFENIILSIQRNHKKHNKKLENYSYINKKYLWKSTCIFIKLIFQSTDSRDHYQSKIIYVTVKSEV